MAIAEYAIASNPADNGTNTTTPVVVTPPGSMTAGQLVWVTVVNGTTTGSIAVSEAGGQSWNAITQVNTSGCRTRWFWCIFNGTWSANPSWSGRSGSYALSALMQVFDGDFGTNTTWVVDVAAVTNTYTAPSTPFTVTIPSITTTKDGALVIATWASADDNTWGSLSGSTHTWTDISGSGYVRNTSTSNHSITTAWLEDATAGTTGSVSKNQATLGGDAGVRCMIVFQQKKIITQSDTGSGVDTHRKGARLSDSSGGAVSGTIAASGDNGQFIYDAAWMLYGVGASGVWFGRWNAKQEALGLRFTLNAAIPGGVTITKADVACNGYSNHDVHDWWGYVSDDDDSPALTASSQRPSWLESGSTTTYPATEEGAGALHDTSGDWVSSGWNTKSFTSLIQYLVNTYGGLASGAHITVWLVGDNGLSSDSENGLYAKDDAGTTEATLSITYTAPTGVDALSVYKGGGATPKTVSDTGAGVDSNPTIEAEILQTDTGTGTDTHRKGMRNSDTGSGTDTHRKGLLESDTGVGVDTHRKGMRISDPGSGVDTLALIKAMLGIVDIGAGVDVESVYKGGTTPKSVSDAGSGVDTHIKGMRGSDAGSGVDTHRKGIRDTDIGSGADTHRKGIRDIDTGVGVDTHRKGLREVDTGSGVDTHRKGTRLSDTGSGADLISFIKAILAIHETGTGTDVIFVSTGVVPKTVSDTGVGVDSAPSIKVKVFIGDTAVGAYTKVGGAWYGCGIYVKVSGAWKTS